MDAAERRAFLAEHHRAVIVTRRADGRLQSSPVLCTVDADGYAVISVTRDRAKTRNLRRDPWATLCVFTDDFFGPWVQVEGEAQVIDLPDALPGLEDLYRRISGEHPDWDAYRAAMVADGRCLVRIPITDDGPAAG